MGDSLQYNTPDETIPQLLLHLDQLHNVTKNSHTRSYLNFHLEGGKLKINSNPHLLKLTKFSHFTSPHIIYTPEKEKSTE